MGIERMSLLTVEGNLDRLDDALMLCCDSKLFQITDSGSNTALHTVNEQNPYESAYNSICEMAATLNITPKLCGYDHVEQQTGEEFESYCSAMNEELSEIKKDFDEVSASLEEHLRTDSYVKHLIGLDVSFHDLFSMRYINAVIGRMPAESQQKLEYYENKCIHFIPFESNAEYVWGVYLAPKNSTKFAEMVMNSLYFEAAVLPDYLNADAATSDIILEQIIEDEIKLKEQLEKELNSFADDHRDEFLAVMSKLKYLYDCNELRKKALIDEDRFTFTGYCPTKQCKTLTEKLTAIEGVVTVEVPIKGKTASSDVPVKLKNNILFRPFEMFVKMYGLPEYGSFDPTPYVAVTYMLMFGIMFGDVGQGLAISLLGLIGSRFSKNGLFPIMTRIGILSAAFGVLYGSVFGIETIIEPFFHRENIWRLLGYTERPENIFQVATVLLIAALCIGIVLIIISMSFNTVLNFRKRKWGEALFSVNGVCGLIFYISLIAGAGGMFMLGTNLFTPAYIICLIVLPLVLIFFKHPLSDLISGTKHSEKISVGNFIIEN
ncbi:MAG: ATPase, partial [Oscillospiraceae bacterium]|nr:ATPase [Oscillospiraceae bacterium]